MPPSGTKRYRRSTGHFGEIRLAAGLRDGANAKNVIGTLDGGQGSASVKDIECMAALHDTVISGKRQLAIETEVALSLVIIELLTHHVDICDLEVICRELTLVFKETFP